MFGERNDNVTMDLVDARSASICMIAAAFLLLSACSNAANPDTGNKPANANSDKAASKELSLAIEGYNYTNRYIDTFSVDGAGGGNIRVSSPTGGGGGTVCCASYFPGIKNYTVMVRWQSNACTYQVRSPASGEVFKRPYSFYKEQEVPVEEIAARDAKYMEIHFFPGGEIKAKVTASASLPLLALNKDREDRSDFPPCPGNVKPEN